MKIRTLARLTLSFALISPAFATVSVSSPLNLTTVGTTFPVIASGTTTCAKGISGMGVYVDTKIAYQVSAASINTSLTLTPGAHRVTVAEWDKCSSTSNAVLNVTVVAAAPSSVVVSSPANGATVSTLVSYVATGTTECAKGVTAMGVYVAGKLAYKSPGAVLNTQITLPVGAVSTTVKEWDKCGGTAQTVVKVTAKKLATAIAGEINHIQTLPSWNQWGEMPPVYDICTSECKGITWLMTQHVSSTSLSGDATKFDIGGTAPYSDVLWSNKLIGQGTTINMPDTARKILPNVHGMTFDADILLTNLAATQDLELDLNIYMNGVGMEWGLQCNHLNGKVWDYWNNINTKWVHTSIPCNLKEGVWNHVTFDVSRLANNNLVYNSITENGVKSNMGITVVPFAVPTGWYGMTVNYQMDGNSKMQSNTTYLDNLTVAWE